jgi:hypothetical protein
MNLLPSSSSSLKIEAAGFSEILIPIHQSAWRHIPAGVENLKYYY